MTRSVIFWVIVYIILGIVLYILFREFDLNHLFTSNYWR